MKTDTISKKEIVRLYEKSTKKQQSVLNDVFGREFFDIRIQERIKTFEDACVYLGLEPKVPDFGKLRHLTQSVAHYKLMIISEALNEEWEPDWDDTNQQKWWPWFNLSSGFGFSSSDFSYDGSTTAVGSRLCFKSKELSDYAAKQFEDIYKDLML